MKKILFLIVLTLFIMVEAFAYLQVIYTPDSIVEGSEVLFKVVFTHPFSAEHTMDIGLTKDGEVKGFKEFNIIHKGKSLNAVNDLKQITFTSLENSGVAYDFVLNRENGFKGGGDWVIIGVPNPYYEASEDIYIQQITKVMVNKGGFSTDWEARLADGYPEIVPYVKPYAVWEGGMFRAKVVDTEGKPVPSAEIEIEYINHDVDMNANKFSGAARIEKKSHGTAVIRADWQGNFSFIPPKAGYWGFAAIGAGGEKKHDGKELSLDAVLWIEAKSLDAAEAAAAPEVEKEPGSDDEASASGGGNVSALIIIIVIIVVLALVLVFAKKRKNR